MSAERAVCHAFSNGLAAVLALGISLYIRDLLQALRNAFFPALDRLAQSRSFLSNLCSGLELVINRKPQLCQVAVILPFQRADLAFQLLDLHSLSGLVRHALSSFSQTFS